MDQARTFPQTIGIGIGCLVLALGVGIGTFYGGLDAGKLFTPRSW